MCAQLKRAAHKRCPQALDNIRATGQTKISAKNLLKIYLHWSVDSQP